MKNHFHRSLKQRGYQWGTQGRYDKLRVKFIKKSLFKTSFSEDYPKDGISGVAQKDVGKQNSKVKKIRFYRISFSQKKTI